MIIHLFLLNTWMLGIYNLCLEQICIDCKPQFYNIKVGFLVGKSLFYNMKVGF